MLRVYASKNSGQAKSYFSAELTRGDYYFGEQEIVGQWGGKAAENLGISGAVTQEAFDCLVDNIHPQTGEQLTPRQREDRRPGYDLTFSAPKALSVLYEYSKDEQLLTAFRSAVHRTMEDIEEQVHARVRKNGADEDRATGNLAYAEFVHFTARPVESMAPDPQLHAHCYVMNATHDKMEGQWKAAQMGQIKTDAPYYEALFHSRLSKSLADMGLDISKDGKFWTIDGLEKETLDKFSNRTEEIEQVAKEKGITSEETKSQLGATTRSAKVGGLLRDQLREQWWDRLTTEEERTLQKLSEFTPSESDGSGVQEKSIADVQFALDHQLERQSVVPLTRLKESALREGFGVTTETDVEAALAEQEDMIVRPIRGRDMATTNTVLQEEADIIAFTASGYGTQDKLNPEYELGKVTDHKEGKQFELADEQKYAVKELLDSRHRVQAVQGKAGVGKTTALATLIDGIEQGGGRAVVLAPTADAAYATLKNDGEAYKSLPMQNAHTHARFFVDESLWEQSRGNTLIVDEAGLLSVGDMHNLFALANSYDNRVILVGDTSQHSSVQRGDAFRILQQEADLNPLNLNTIRRQKPDDYRKAVKKISEGNIVDGYDLLDKQEAVIEESDDEARYRSLADKYAATLEKGKSALTVAPTNAEGAVVTEAIRAKLLESGKLAKKEKSVMRFSNLQLTNAEKGQAHYFKKGQMIRYQQNAKGVDETIKRGEQFTVSRTDQKHVWMTDAKNVEHQLNLTQAKRFNVYDPQEMQVAVGEIIRITEGGKSKDGKRLNNGSLHTVKSVEKNGDISTDKGRILDGSKGNIDYGYVTTSHSSQGKTVDHVFIAQGADYGGASSAEQFYVSVSRGKQSVEIFTDNKEELREQIQRSHQRLSATELTKNQPSLKERMNEPKTVRNALQFYAAHVMEHLRGTASDWLQQFRRSDQAPANEPSWEQRIRAEQEVER